MPEGQRLRRVTPRPRAGAAAESARLQQRRNGQEELPKSEVRGSSREELPCVLGQVRRPEGATPCPDTRGHGRRPRGPTPRPRSSGSAGAGGPRGAIPR